MLEAAIPSGFGGLKGADAHQISSLGPLFHDEQAKKVKKVTRIRADAVW
jgi:hypothetical protein